MLAPLRFSIRQAPAANGLARSMLATRGLATAAPVTWTPAPESQPASLHLKSGHSWSGKSFGAQMPKRFGEVVFTTSITSYTESLTDPSYQGQILTFTQPLIGNYGVPNNFTGTSPVGNAKDVDVGSFLESRGVQAAGVVVSNLAERFSHFEAIESLASWCARHNVPGISGVDTRAITTLLRDQGSTLGAITMGEGHEVAPGQADFTDPQTEKLIERVSTKQPYTIHPVGGASAARVHIALLDFGSKANIVRCLIREGASVTVLPYNYDFNAVRDQFDGLFLSNGPGSPYSIPESIETVKRTIEQWDKPIFGICMGHQIIGLAAGIEAYRMRFGNRGHNQPVIALASTGSSIKRGRVYLSSQNHGWALKHPTAEKPWGKWDVLFGNVNDGSIEGICSSPDSGKQIWGVQFHPENAGGPDDCQGMFKDFIDVVEAKTGGKGAGKGLDSGLLAPPPEGPFGAVFKTADELRV